MAAKTLGELFPDATNNEVASEEENVAVQVLRDMTDMQTKDARMSLRINSNSYKQLKAVAVKKGIPVAGIITMLINDFLRENQDIISK